ncbi:MAG: plasmid mobilization relaxosome protein MobC [Verrucomicrobiota bacterium]
MATHGEVGLTELAAAVNERATALSTWAKQLRRVGINLNQITHLMHRHKGSIAAPAALEDVIKKIEICLQQLQFANW